MVPRASSQMHLVAQQEPVPVCGVTVVLLEESVPVRPRDETVLNYLYSRKHNYDVSIVSTTVTGEAQHYSTQHTAS